MDGYECVDHPVCGEGKYLIETSPTQPGLCAICSNFECPTGQYRTGDCRGFVNAYKCVEPNYRPKFADNIVLSVKENMPVGSIVGTVTATDGNLAGTAAARLIYFLAGDHASLFSISSSTGVVTTQQTFDRDCALCETSYSVDVHATDAGAPSFTGFGKFTVDIIDEVETTTKAPASPGDETCGAMEAPCHPLCTHTVAGVTTGCGACCSMSDCLPFCSSERNASCTEAFCAKQITTTSPTLPATTPGPHCRITTGCSATLKYDPPKVTGITINQVRWSYYIKVKCKPKKGMQKFSFAEANAPCLVPCLILVQRVDVWYGMIDISIGCKFA